ncbi:hypothetical protein JM949_35700, partial [Micromonospora sp. STR1s_6]|nr:hypothetical protein [Micromonospora tarensis]
SAGAVAAHWAAALRAAWAALPTSSAVATGTVLTGDVVGRITHDQFAAVAARAPHPTHQLRNRVHAALHAPAPARQTRFARLRAG